MKGEGKVDEKREWEREMEREREQRRDALTHLTISKCSPPQSISMWLYGLWSVFAHWEHALPIYLWFGKGPSWNSQQVPAGFTSLTRPAQATHMHGQRNVLTSGFKGVCNSCKTPYSFPDTLICPDNYTELVVAIAFKLFWKNLSNPVFSHWNMWLKAIVFRFFNPFLRHFFSCGVIFKLIFNSMWRSKSFSHRKHPGRGNSNIGPIWNNKEFPPPPLSYSLWGPLSLQGL